MKVVGKDEDKTFYGAPSAEEKEAIDNALEGLVKVLKSTNAMQEAKDGTEKHGFGLLRKNGMMFLFLDIKGLPEKDYDTMAKIMASFGLMLLESAAERVKQQDEREMAVLTPKAEEIVH